MKKHLLLYLLFFRPFLNYAQIEIREEVILNPSPPPAQSEGSSTALTMPFYGKVKEVITCGSYVQSRTRYSLIVDGQNYPFGPCQNWTCGGYPLNCYCVAGNPQKEVSDVSQGTLIQTIFEKCISDNGKDYYWQTLEYEFQYVSETSYRIIVTKLEGGTADIGSITFTPTTPPPPPDCPNANNNYCSSTFTEDMPPLTIIERNKDFTVRDECLDPDPFDNEIRVGFFAPAFAPSEASNIKDLTTQDIVVCYDLETQSWKFKLIINETELNVVIDICEDAILNLPADIVNNIDEIDGLPTSECFNLISSIRGHGRYPYEIPTNGYVFKEVILAHEESHKNKWEEFITKYLSEYENIFKDISFDCNSYLNSQDASEKGLKYLKEKFYISFLNTANFDHRWSTGLDQNNKDYEKLRYEEEVRANSTSLVDSIRKEYLLKIISHCNSN